MSEEYPIQVIRITEKDHHKPYASGGPKKRFSSVDRTVRSLYSQKVSAISDSYQKSFIKWPTVPNIAKVVLRKDAIAKSHRPKSLFNIATCPIIGDFGFGKLFIRVNPNGLAELQNILENGTTQENVANISTLENIDEYSTTDRYNSTVLNSYINADFLKISLFDFKDLRVNQQTEILLIDFFNEIGISRYEKLEYGKNQIIFKAKIGSADELYNLCEFPPIKKVSLFPQYEPLRTANIVLGDLHDGIFSKPDTSVEYPTVGIIDSGIKDNNSALSEWVEARQKRIIDSETDFEHGSFVGGLIANNHSLNHSDPRFPNVQSKIIDIRALSSTNGISEEDLKKVVEDAVKTFPHVRVWNLSLGSSESVDIDSYSPLASFFDELQDKYNVLFVVSAGNYNQVPLREWPPSNHEIDDRVSTPGDSCRALTVGSISHKSTPISLVKNEEPSPFSRRGPGPSFIPKPEIIHYGGNCDDRGNYSQTGVLSVSADAKHSENIGTSFSTPIVSSIVAQYTQLVSGTISKELLKAFAIHSAVLDSPIRSAEDVKYYGFGKPTDPISFLQGIMSPDIKTGFKVDSFLI